MADSNSLEVEFPKNGCTLSGLIALFREAKDSDENYDRNFFSDELDEAYTEIYNNLEDVEGFSLTVEFDR